jgi:hypothetical protein
MVFLMIGEKWASIFSVALVRVSGDVVELGPIL